MGKPTKKQKEKTPEQKVAEKINKILMEEDMIIRSYPVIEPNGTIGARSTIMPKPEQSKEDGEK